VVSWNGHLCMSKDSRRPAFIVLGAVKAATTWIAHQLRNHPDLWLPNAEPHYFSTEYHRGPDWYRSLFADAPAGRILGEKSADYLAHPDAPSRIASTLPTAKLIVQLRDPTERAYSDYCMLYRRGDVGADPRRYLANRRRYLDRGQSVLRARFLEGGLYGAHINRYLEHFPRHQLKIILYEDIRCSPERVIADVCEHIEVGLHFTPDEIGARKNDSTSPILPLPLRRMLRPARSLLDPLRSNPILSRLRSAMTSKVRYPPLTDELREMLRTYYRDDISRLEDVLDRDLTQWRTGAPSQRALIGSSS
jgi:hypothetical protein